MAHFFGFFQLTDSFEKEYGLIKAGRGYSRTSVNTSIFRKSSIISDGKVQFISFYDAKGRIVIGKRTLGEKKFILKKQPFRGNVRDAHNIISLGLDGDGYLHLAYGMHNTPLQYARSIVPGSLSMERIDTTDGIEEMKVTYPEFHILPAGDLLFAYRSGKSGNGNMVIKRYLLKEQKWETVQTSLLDGEGERNAYWQMCIDDNGIIHISWVWRETGDVSTNHDLCYARSRDFGQTWEKSDGTPYELPIREGNADIIWKIPQNSKLMNQTSMTADNESRPYIATYWRDMDSLVPQYHLVWLSEDGWKESRVGERKTPFSLKGGGTKMVPISRPLVLVRNKEVWVIFRDIERGGNVTIAKSSDLENGKWILEDITPFEVGAWEPTYDENLWKLEGKLNLLVQVTRQGDGEKVINKGEKESTIWIQECL
ncbi:MAG: BNR repeat-containing protein [Muribaculaceae bacterium]|nr:BNR repeat-containing protein [Muribaculaceae bacterium]